MKRMTKALLMTMMEISRESSEGALLFHDDEEEKVARKMMPCYLYSQRTEISLVFLCD